MRDELRNFAYKTLVVVAALTLCAGLATAATSIGTNIQTDGMFAAVGTSTFSGRVGISTTTPGSLFSIGAITNFTAATSTFYSTGGINLTAGCFAVNGTCVGSSVSGGGSGIQTVTIPLTANDINHLFSAPKTIVAAPGAGKAIIPVGAIWLALNAGTIVDDSENGGVGIYYGSAAGSLLANAGGLLLSDTSQIGYVLSNGQFAGVDNQPLVFAGSGENLVNGGAIATATLGAGGLDYAPGDTGVVNPSGTAVYVVDTVGAGGAVLTFHFSALGNANNVGAHATSVNTGGGDGNFTVNITGITPGNGTVNVTVTYQVVTLP